MINYSIANPYLKKNRGLATDTGDIIQYRTTETRKQKYLLKPEKYSYFLTRSASCRQN